MKADLDALRFVAGASALFEEGLDLQRTLQSVVRYVVPYLADVCTIDLVEGEIFTRVAAAHVDPAKKPLAYELARRWPRRDVGLGKVIATGEPELLPEIDDALLAKASVDEEHLRLSLVLAPRSGMALPLKARGRVPRRPRRGGA